MVLFDGFFFYQSSAKLFYDFLQEFFTRLDDFKSWFILKKKHVISREKWYITFFVTWIPFLGMWTKKNPLKTRDLRKATITNYAAFIHMLILIINRFYEKIWCDLLTNTHFISSFIKSCLSWRSEAAFYLVNILTIAVQSTLLWFV